MGIQSMLRRAMSHPREIVPGIVSMVTRLRVRRVERDGVRYFEYGGELYPEYLHRGNAASFIRKTAQEYCRGRGIDVGANAWALPGSIPIDEGETENALRLDRFAAGSLDYVFSSHCLEHIAPWQEALRLWISKLKRGGILFLYLPHESNLLWRPGGPWVGARHKWSPTWQAIVPFLEAEGMEVVEFNRERDDYWSFHIVAKRKG